jgi:hypothetical protein
MSRDIHSATSTALSQDTVVEAWFIRLDILGDPVQIWTAARDIMFTGPTATGDPKLDGLLFEGMGELGGIGQIVDGRGGSQAVQLTLPGIDLADDALRQVVFNKNRWQRRQAWIWISTLDGDYNIIGRPFRVKTGRIDKMNVGQGRDGQNFVSVTIESHQAYAGEILNTKYSEQRELDSTDTSQDYVHALANMQPVVGGANAGNPPIANTVSNLLSGKVWGKPGYSPVAKL